MLDVFQNYMQDALPCYLIRKATNAENTDYASLGFQISVTGGQGGYTTQQILPMPEVEDVSTHDIGMSGGRLQFGARKFTISDTFVRNQMAALGLTDPYLVFRDPLVLGILYNGRLFAIEILVHDDFGGEALVWTVTGNALETATPIQNTTPPLS